MMMAKHWRKAKVTAKDAITGKWTVLKNFVFVIFLVIMIIMLIVIIMLILSQAAMKSVLVSIVSLAVFPSSIALLD